MIQLNAPEQLGKVLKEAGIERVKFVPTSWLRNECKEVIVYISFQEADRMMKNLEHLLVYVDEKKEK